MPLIVLEGLDGAGKSTQLARLIKLLESGGSVCEFLHFPRFDVPVYGDLIARFLRGELGSLDQVNPYLVALIFAGDRAAASQMVAGWLEQGKYVIMDRFVYSNVAFQCAKLDDKSEQDRLRKWILELEFGHNRLPHPDASLFLDVPFGFTQRNLEASRTGDDREYLKGAKDIHEESLELQRKVRDIYITCAQEDDRLHVVDCSDGAGNIDTQENNFDKIASIIQPLIGR